jgi:hypothetical protein
MIGQDDAVYLVHFQSSLGILRTDVLSLLRVINDVYLPQDIECP